MRYIYCAMLARVTTSKTIAVVELWSFWRVKSGAMTY